MSGDAIPDSAEGFGAIFSGLSICWPVQFHLLTAVLGVYDTDRIWHLACTAGFPGFFAGHLVLVSLAARGGEFVSMITGWKTVMIRDAEREPVAEVMVAPVEVQERSAQGTDDPGPSGSL